MCVAEGLYWPEMIEVTFMLVSLTAVGGYAFRVAILRPVVWMVGLWGVLALEAYDLMLSLDCVLEIGGRCLFVAAESQIPNTSHLSSGVIVGALILVSVLTLPAVVAQYLYAYRSAEIWNDE